jgi:hypothetical protein
MHITYRKKSSGIFPAVIIAFLSATACAENGFYSDITRMTMALPRDASLSRADITFSPNATPNTNPASLVFEQKSAIDVSYAGYYGNAYSTSILSYRTNVDSLSGIGLSLCYLYVPDIEVTADLEQDESGYPVYDPSRISFTSTSDIVGNILYGRRFFSRPAADIAAGIRLHGLRRRLPGATGYGIGLDAGLVAAFPRPGLRLSLAIDNFTTNFIYWNSSYSDVSLPSLRLGAGWNKEIPYIYGTVGIFYATPDVLGKERIWLRRDGTKKELTLAERGNTVDQAVSFLFMGHYGAEYCIRNIVTLRGGFSSGQFSFGGGINMFASALSIDFSYLSSELDGSYIVSAGYHW